MKVFGQVKLQKYNFRLVIFILKVVLMEQFLEDFRGGIVGLLQVLVILQFQQTVLLTLVQTQQE